ncbi:MAG TPA: TIGR03364 family FAD-dependent oxidoreductase [Usitatibacter sp.]|nr:TIGR03364 family FAD-dependent oxidoreductase [Usitatibacter sp.]
MKYDLAVVGAGIVGLAHALAGVRRGLRVVVLEREARANGASVRNFGFITVNGQEAGLTRARALRSREVWEDVAREAGINVLQRGSIFVAQRPEAMAVLEEYAASPEGEECEVRDAAASRQAVPQLGANVQGALFSPREMRIEARDALPAIAAWLEECHGVVFSWGNATLDIEEGGRIRHAHGTVEADAIVVAPGTGTAEFSPRIAKDAQLRQCTLQMLRLADPGWRLPGVVLGDLSLLRYGGMAAQPSLAKLRARVERECAAEIAEGVHLIVAQSADGSLVIGDSHRYADHALPFASARLDALIVGQLHALLDIPDTPVVERWLGHYAVANVKPMVREELGARARLVTVTNGLGMSTAFAIGEETIAELFG